MLNLNGGGGFFGGGDAGSVGGAFFGFGSGAFVGVGSGAFFGGAIFISARDCGAIFTSALNGGGPFLAGAPNWHCNSGGAGLTSLFSGASLVWPGLGALAFPM